MSAARSSRVVALSFLVLAAVLASTLPANAAASSRSLSIKASSTTPTVGSSVTVSGVLSRSPKGATVTVQRLSGSRWVTAKSARTTSTKGAYSAMVTVPSAAGTLKLRAVAKAIKNRKAATSRTISLDVRRAVSVTSAVSPARTTVGSTVTLSGAVAPFVAGTTVTIERVVGTKATSLSPTTTVDAAGGYTATITPASSGSFTYRAVVAGRPGYATAISPGRTVVVDAAPAPTITTTSLPTALKGAPYSADLTASVAGTWALRAGSLPPGLVLSRAGAITGTPTADSASSTFTVRFTSSAGGATVDRSYTVDSRRIIATSAVPAGQLGVPYSTQLRTNAPLDGTWGTRTGAPAGLTLSADGVLGGTPSGSGGTSFFVATFTPRGSSTYADEQSIFPEVESGMPSAPSASRVSGGYMYGCRVVAESGRKAACWGTNLGGQLGTGPIGQDNQVVTSAKAVAGDASWATIDTGDFYSSCGIRTDRSLWCWGRDNDGILGGGPSTQGVSADSPRPVTGAGAWTDVTVANDYACGIKADGSLWCWGSNRAGQLGRSPSTTSQSTSPVLVDATTTWTTVSAAQGAVCGIRTDASLWCWDADGMHQVAGAWRTVDAGPSSCGVRTDGSLWCWGDNRSGQLGDGTRTDRAQPVQVGTLTTWRQTSVSPRGAGTACATRTDGTAWCWGSNSSGQLGNGRADSSSLPVRVDETLTWSSVDVGADFACGVKNDGSQRCWGTNVSAELGNGNQRDSAFPTKVLG